MLDYQRPTGVRPSRYPDSQLVLFDGSAVQAFVARDAPARGPTDRVEEATADRLVAAERRLEAERLRKQAFVSTLAHELRQPLSTLLAGIEILRRTAGSESASAATAIMKRQIAQMNRLIEDIMDGARWACGKVTLRTRRVDLRDVIAEAAQDVAAAVAERGHELVVVTGCEPLWADADPQRLQQVLSNLLRNAVKYTDPGGRISLVGHQGPATITLEVSDTGRGIEADALSHIFDLYSQAGADETGLGIGLSVVQEIVGLHKGWIEARSDGPGKGSEFTVTLPAAAQA